MPNESDANNTLRKKFTVGNICHAQRIESRETKTFLGAEAVLTRKWLRVLKQKITDLKRELCQRKK